MTARLPGGVTSSMQEHPVLVWPQALRLVPATTSPPPLAPGMLLCTMAVPFSLLLEENSYVVSANTVAASLSRSFEETSRVLSSLPLVAVVEHALRLRLRDATLRVAFVVMNRSSGGDHSW